MINQELALKYHTLLDTFRTYWKDNFADSCQEDSLSEIDSNPLSSFAMGACIRYGLLCVLQEKPIPDNCKYEDLVKQVHDWIAYRED